MKFTGFNLMPRPHLPDGPRAPDVEGRDRGERQLDRALQAADPVAEESAILDVIRGGRLLAGFPVGTRMDTNFLLARSRR